VTCRVVGVFAHPDDDTYGVAGSLARHAAEDLELTVVMATSGDAGRIADPSLATRQSLGAVREAEDLAAWRALGMEPDVRFLRHPDGGLDRFPKEQLAAEVLAVLEETKAHLVITFGPDGITGHADHIAIGAAATEAFHVARASARRGTFARLLHLAVPETGLERLNELLRGRGLEPLDPSQPYVPRGVSDELIGVTVDCADAYDRKLEALRCHKTQGEMEDIPFDLWHEILGTETFVLAWPERAPDDPVLSDVLEGLAGP
jgi:LmbE family N-acetylglucosaminyl deacetylase